MKPKLVMIVPRFPYPLEKGDKLRAYNQLKELSDYFSITLIYISEKKISLNELKQLQPFCASIHEIRISIVSKITQMILCLFNQNPFQVGYFYSFMGHRRVKNILRQVKPNHIYCQLIRAAEYVKDYHSCDKTIDYMDALSAGMEKRVNFAPFYSRKFFRSEANRLKIYERRIFEYFENKIIISEQDRDFIGHPKKEQIQIIPNGIDERFFEELKISKSYDLVFVGNLSYAPNIEAVKFISSELANMQTGWKCLVSGANPSASIHKIAKANKNIILQDWVDDIRESYCKGKIFVAPMLIGTGMQNKLLEAMALGIPCVTTTLANNAIKAKENVHIMVADNPELFRASIANLLTNSDLYRELATNGRIYIRENYDWKRTSQHLRALLRKVHDSNHSFENVSF